MIKKYFFLFFLALFSYIPLLTALQLSDQEVAADDQYLSGIPFIQHINIMEHSGYVRNWDMVQDSDGILYFGNTGNLMIYDGSRWTENYIRNGTVFSLLKSSDQLIYVGGQDELGFLHTSDSASQKIHTYTSLSERYFEQYMDGPGTIWQILESGDKIYFRSNQFLIEWDGEEFNRWQPEYSFGTSVSIHDKIYLHNRDVGLSELTDGHINIVENGELLSDAEIYGILPYTDDQLLIATRNKGLVIFDGNSMEQLHSRAAAYLEEHRVYKSIQLEDGTYVFGTLDKGIIRIDAEGKILSILNNNNGLPEDAVYSLFLDKNGALYLLHDEHVSKVDFHLPMRLFDERSKISGIVNDIDFFLGHVVVATDQGVFSRELNDDGLLFQMLTNEKTYCQNLSQTSVELVFRCDGKVLAWDGISVKDLISIDRVRLLKTSRLRENIIYAGTANNTFGVIDKRKEKYQFHTIEELSGYEFTSIFEENNSVIWIGTAQASVIRISMLDLIDRIDNDNVLEYDKFEFTLDREESSQYIRIFSVDSEPLFATAEESYRFDSANNQFILYDKFGPDFFSPYRQIYRLHEDFEKNIWMRSSRAEQVAYRQADGTFRVESNQLERIRANQINVIKSHPEKGIYFGGNSGLIFYNHNQRHQFRNDFTTVIRDVFVRNDSLIYSGVINHTRMNEKPVLNYEDNELRFRYSATSYDLPELTTYQFQLVGFETNWSNWVQESQRDYTNIPEGEYTFTVRARDVYGNISEATSFTFTILPPWYRTWWAYLFYLVTVSGILYTVHKIRINRILEVQGIRNRIASDLHDEISATLSSISFFSEAIQRKSDSDEMDNRFVELISKSAGEAKESISDIIWSINPENDDWKVLFVKCRRFASDIFDSCGIRYTIDIIEDIPRNIDIELRQHLWLIFKEIVTNVARHSEADQVSVLMNYRDRTLVLEVSDNGKGINTEDADKGNGLKNIRKRAEKVEAEIKLTTGQFGTTWRFAKKF